MKTTSDIKFLIKKPFGIQETKIVFKPRILESSVPKIPKISKALDVPIKKGNVGR